MRTALKSKAGARQTIAAVRAIPAPVGGWNTRDPLAAMDRMDAIVLENWVPKTTHCEVREGYESHATGMTGDGKTLAVYNALNGTNAMFCATASGVYNVTSAGAVGASVAARTNGKHQQTMFGDGSSNWLILVNGVDKPLYYDGSTWTAVDAVSTPALTGLTTTSIIGVNVFKGRLFFIEKNSLNFWYLAAGAAGGALTKFDLSGEARRGGFLMAMATWTRDAGDGQDDVAAFITSEGEAIIYQGNNPGAAANWVKAGSYFLGKPIGRRCITQYGGDVVVLTENGAFPLSAALQSAIIDYKLALSFKIEPTFTEAARTYGATFGWEITSYPAQSALIVNVPNAASEAAAHQYVMNTITKSWCRFTGWNADCFAVFNKQLYFARGTSVFKAWSGTDDNGEDIVATAKTAFNNFGTARQKTIKLFRPVLAVNGSLSFLTDVDMDFADGLISGAVTYPVAAGARWGVAKWGQAQWASGTQIVKVWTAPAEWMGYSAAGKLKINNSSLIIKWMASEYVYETGSIL